jgi:hypothetical protein
LFVHSSAHLRLSFADISNRAVQGLIEESRLDLFVIGGEIPAHHQQLQKTDWFSPTCLGGVMACG